MNLFFDLDGTLTDSSNRHFKVYSEIVLSLGGKPMTKKDYWCLIRSKTDKSLILKKSSLGNINAEAYLKKFKTVIEKTENLAYEKLINKQILKTLKKFKQKHKLFLITLRSNDNAAYDQINNLGLSSYFDKIIVCPKSKAEAIKPYLDDKCALIGDTELDIQTAKSLGIKSIAVSSGFRNTKYLKRFKPDYILSSIADLEKVIKD